MVRTRFCRLPAVTYTSHASSSLQPDWRETVAVEEVAVVKQGQFDDGSTELNNTDNDFNTTIQACFDAAAKSTY
eukprot:COSAG06_NODE_2932_length_6073_cov_5.295782_5_plen_74_part_00